MSERLDALLREHAEKYDPAVLEAPHAAAPSDGQIKSLYYQDLEQRADRQKITVAEVLARDQERLADSEFPTAECLKPGEVLLAALKHRSLPSARWQHYERCLFCQALVGTSRPDEATKADLIRVLAKRAVERPATPLRLPLGKGFRLPVATIGTASAYMLKGWALLAAIFVMLIFTSDGARQKVGGLIMGLGAKHTDVERRLVAAMVSDSRGEDQKVIELTNYVLRKDPKNTVALSLRGQAWWKLGIADKAKADYGTLLLTAADYRDTGVGSGDFWQQPLSYNVWDWLGYSKPARQRTNYADLAAAYLQLSEQGENPELRNKSLRDLNAKLGYFQATTPVSQLDIAQAYSKVMGWSAAEPALGDPATIQKTALAAGWHHYASMSQIGDQLRQQAHYREAQPLVLVGYQGMKNLEGSMTAPDNAALKEAAKRVVGLYESWGKPDEVAAWKAKLGLAELPPNVFADH
jgi:hypothetical protein